MSISFFLEWLQYPNFQFIKDEFYLISHVWDSFSNHRLENLEKRLCRQLGTKYRRWDWKRFETLVIIPNQKHINHQLVTQTIWLKIPFEKYQLSKVTFYLLSDVAATKNIDLRHFLILLVSGRWGVKFIQTTLLLHNRILNTSTWVMVGQG